MEEEVQNPSLETPAENQPERSFRDEFLGQRSRESSSGKKVVIGILVLLLVAGVVGAIIFVRARSPKSQSVLPSSVTTPAVVPTTETTPTLSPTPSPKLTPTPSPTPLPKTSTVLKAYKIQVLNGSGVTGAAGKVVKLLEAEGAVGVQAANASSYNYESTEVSLKKDAPATVFSTIKNALTGYTVVKGADLSETSEFDVVVIVGAK